jgi:hypothetical protein
MYLLVVTIDIKPGFRDKFLEAMLETPAALSARSPGACAST